MVDKRTGSRIVGTAIGTVVVVAGVFSVFAVDWATAPTVEPPPVRPLKTMVVDSSIGSAVRKYPGSVRAAKEVDLAFHVSGPLIDFLVKRGDRVESGTLLARIDPRDFQSILAAKTGVLEKAVSDYDKLKRLYEQGHAGRQEVVDAKASYEVADAEKQMAAKALDDTQLRAPFAGVIADTFVENFQDVRAQQGVLSLQDVSSVEIEVHVPEGRVAVGLKNRDDFTFVASFEYLADRQFDVTLSEFSTVADPATQTFAATFLMPAPDDVSILPGMTATITPFRREAADTGDSACVVPINAVPVDGIGNYFVWRLEKDDTGTWTVNRVDVTVGEMFQNDILITSGIQRGDRIATAGVHLLEHGQKVRLLANAGDETR